MKFVADSLDPRTIRDDLSRTTVTITRTSEADFKSRQLVVSLDGERVGELLWGDSITVDVSPGTHRLRVHNTLVWKTLVFTVETGEQVYVEAVNRAAASTFFLVSILGVGPLYVTLRRMV
ncbi:MAG: DUF2846 domain-containing protein [Acidobacteria bacterium]|nr:DUF2846 domain-containing protein [Acidobacteriota bacterium]